MKITACFLILLLLSCTKTPLDTLTLSIHYKPDNNYRYTSHLNILTTIKYSGKESALQTLKRRNIPNPTIINKKSEIEANINTGKLEEDNRFPVIVDYISSTSNDNQINAIIHGKCFKNSFPVFDVVVVNNLDVQSKKYLLESWNKTFSQLSFKGEKLKIGQELVVQKPLSIPMEGSEIDMIVTTTYKLLEIKEKIASFDITQQYTLNPKLLDNSFDGTGKGNGQMFYDIENSIASDYTLNTQIQLTKKLDSFEFQLNSNSNFKQTNKIKLKNKN